MRRALLFLASLGLAALAAAVALAQVGGEPGAMAAAISASGDFEISNSRDGLPVFAATGIGPGDSARGTVEIADTGSVPVQLTLSRHDLLDAPGLGGGLLSEALALTVTDVTNAGAPVALYGGPLASMPDQRAGRLEPGASRTYEFVATLPAGGSPGEQNAVQGASVSVAYAWTATEAEAGPQPATNASPPAQLPAAQPPPPAAALELEVTRASRKLHGGKLVVWAGCDAPCAILVKGRLKATAGGKHRGAKVTIRSSVYRAGTQKLKIPVPSKLRRWLATAPGKRKLRAKLTLTGTDPAGTTDVVKRTLALRPPPRR
jgi:hypothetical protein